MSAHKEERASNFHHLLITTLRKHPTTEEDMRQLETQLQYCFLPTVDKAMKRSSLLHSSADWEGA